MQLGTPVSDGHADHPLLRSPGKGTTSCLQAAARLPLLRLLAALALIVHSDSAEPGEPIDPGPLS
jgi:hypothetical protein